MIERCCLQSHRTPSQPTYADQSRNQMTRSSRRQVELSHQMHEEDFSSNRSLTWPKQAYAPTNQPYPDGASSSNRGKRKIGQQRGSHLLDAMRTSLGP